MSQCENHDVANIGISSDKDKENPTVDMQTAFDESVGFCVKYDMLQELQIAKEAKPQITCLGGTVKIPATVSGIVSAWSN
jgi:hypothetical protein